MTLNPAHLVEHSDRDKCTCCERHARVVWFLGVFVIGSYAGTFLSRAQTRHELKKGLARLDAIEVHLQMGVEADE